MAQINQSTSDSDLTAAIRDDDQEAFRILYFRYSGPLYRFLLHKTREQETAEDLVQELFTRLWKSRGNLDPERPVKAYCYQIAGNLAVDHLRRKVAAPTTAEEEAPTPVTYMDEAGFQTRDQIGKALADLPENQREVFVLSRFGGLKYQEIAQVKQISVKTVENHMGRALKKLRLNLKDLLTMIFFGSR